MNLRRLFSGLVGAILVTVALATAGLGEHPAPLTLGEAVFLALKENPGLKAAGLSVPAAEAQIAMARARFLPEVGFSQSLNNSDNPTQVFMSKLNQRVFTQQDFLLNNLNNPGPYSDWRTGLVAKQPIFQAGEAYLGYQQARLKRDIAAFQVLAARQQLIYQVTKAYIGRQLSEARLRVVQEAKKTAAANRSIVESRFQAGSVVRADVLSADVHLARLTQEEISAAGEVEIARSALATVVGLPEVASRTLAPAPREPAPPPGNLEELKQVAAEKRPDLKRLALAARVARQEQTKARLNFLPRLNIVAQYDIDQKYLFGNSADSYTVMAVMHLNLFNGLARLARTREAAAQAAQAQEQEREFADLIRHQVTESAQHLQTAEARLKVGKAAVDQAREGLRLIRLRYEEGLTILVDLLTAEDAKKEAELNYLTALFDTHLAQAELELAVGTLAGPENSGEKK
jgi:outer membrane protein TolC|uniref:TolC family protein n=1 Tax=Desulfobacca acetoxidans TaxID=60893 RepID=A0A7V6A6W4_9BACT